MQAWLRYALLVTVSAAGTAHWVPPTDATPAYFSAVPSRPTGRLMAGPQLTGPNFSHPFQVTIYQMAARVEKVLYAQPCYCRCDRALRHKSLHSCFEGTHGAECATCMRQAMYAYQQTMLGKTPEEIRAGIEHGDAQALRLEEAAL